MQVHELFDETLYYSLALPSLKQLALVKIAETLLLSRRRGVQELIGMKLQYQAIFERRSLIRWYLRWKDFRERISDDIDRLPCQNIFKRDFRDTTMHLLRNILNFPNPKLFNPAMTMKFTARGDLDLRWMFEDYMTRTLRVPRLSEKRKCQLLADACHLYQDQCVQSILCDLLHSERSSLVPLLKNACRSVEFQRDNRRCSWIISFELDYVIFVGSWERFVTKLNRRYLEDITFSFEQNVLKVTTLGKINHFTDIMFLWPRLTTSGKYDQAHQCMLCALMNWDTPLFIRTIDFLDSAAKMELIDLHVPIIITFLKHPHDRLFLPDLQLDSAGDWTQQIENRAFQIFNHHIFEVFLEGKFCSARQDALIRLWQYALSRNKIHGDSMLLSIKRSLDVFVEQRLFRYDLSSDSSGVIKELYQRLHFSTDLFADIQASEDRSFLLLKRVVYSAIVFIIVSIYFPIVYLALREKFWK